MGGDEWVGVTAPISPIGTPPPHPGATPRRASCPRPSCPQSRHLVAAAAAAAGPRTAGRCPRTTSPGPRDQAPQRSSPPLPRPRPRPPGTPPSPPRPHHHPLLPPRPHHHHLLLPPPHPQLRPRPRPRRP